VKITTERVDRLPGEMGHRLYDMRVFRRRRGLSNVSLDIAFWTSLSGGICTVRAGYIRFDGVGEVEIPETEITLTNVPNTWVFAWCNFADISTAGIEQSPTRAGTMPDGSVFRQPLAHFTSSVPGKYVFAAPGRCHVGDIVRGSPMLGVPT